jgi:DNA-directed RNA polymerase specialized sigma24 family protein
MEIEMRPIIAGTKRETLLKEIYNAFIQWPELERRVFCQAHYYGQSPEAISRSLQLNEEEVRTMLKQCERRLHSSLSNFRKMNCEDRPLAPVDISCPAA